MVKKLSRTGTNLDIVALCDEVMNIASEMVKKQKESELTAKRYKEALRKIEAIFEKQKIHTVIGEMPVFDMYDEDMEEIYEIIQQAFYS